MTIDTRINPLQERNFIPESPVKTTEPVKNTFDSMFQAALDVINETNQFQLDADHAQIDFATGKNDDILTVLLAQEKAYSSLNFTVQVTNKIIESYREIMRMQV